MVLRSVTRVKIISWVVPFRRPDIRIPHLERDLFYSDSKGRGRFTCPPLYMYLTA